MSKKWLAICIILSTFLALLPFLSLPIPSTNTGFISSYGAYLAGTLSPLISFFALIALLKTINSQQAQIKQFSVESQKNEIVRFIEKLDDRIEIVLSNHNVPIEADGEKYSLFQVMTMTYFCTTYHQAVKKENEYLSGNLSSTELRVFESVGSANVCMIRIAEHIEAYKKLSNDKYLESFYFAKYKNLADRLHALDYLSKEKYQLWDRT
ncbi:hypothetical protein L4D20_03585 [Vibrio kyushuensis]|uniref:hypothetical protein n=1 Tax=Vibrio kyushuensis TaxID=2910249 RepID=UPI003D0D63E6